MDFTSYLDYGQIRYSGRYRSQVTAFDLLPPAGEIKFAALCVFQNSALSHT